MPIWEIIALITGVLGVVLTIKQTIWCWPVALISVVIIIVSLFKMNLYGDMCLNIFYFFSGIYGWIYWKQNQNKTFQILKTPVKLIIPLVLITVAQTATYYYILKYFKSDFPLADSILTACSVTCTYMMTKKWLENWIIWVLIDLAYVFLYLAKDSLIYAILLGFMSFVALYGFFSWKKIIQK